MSIYNTYVLSAVIITQSCEENTGFILILQIKLGFRKVKWFVRYTVNKLWNSNVGPVSFQNPSTLSVDNNTSHIISIYIRL